MARQEILDQITQAFGSVPGWMDGMPDAALEQTWSLLGWMMSDSKLSARDKALVAFATASAIHCEY
jgi:alkylhydroperoxidase/carboxymuconolactone decarboxylase family protein YurZ